LDIYSLPTAMTPDIFDLFWGIFDLFSQLKNVCLGIKRNPEYIRTQVVDSDIRLWGNLICCKFGHCPSIQFGYRLWSPPTKS